MLIILFKPNFKMALVRLGFQAENGHKPVRNIEWSCIGAYSSRPGTILNNCLLPEKYGTFTTPVSHRLPHANIHILHRYTVKAINPELIIVTGSKTL